MMSCNNRTDLDPTSFDDLRVLSDDDVGPALADAPEYIARRILEVSEQRKRIDADRKSTLEVTKSRLAK